MEYTRRNLGDAGAMPRCGHRTLISAQEQERLNQLANAVEPARWRVECELVFGHPGDHLAFVIAVHHGEQWWWVRWHPGHRHLEPIELCDFGEHDDQEDDCLLPRGHPGPHSFGLGLAP